jgi:hypothetical protein
MRRYLIFLAFAILGLSGCGVIDTPKGYGKLEDAGEYVYRAVSPKGCGFTVKSVKNEGNCDLDFWTDCVKNQMVKTKGYEFIEPAADWATDSGLKGREMIFRVRREDKEFLYLAAVIMRPGIVWNALYIVEAGGEKSIVSPDLENIRKALKTIR